MSDYNVEMLETLAQIQMINEMSAAINNLAASNMSAASNTSEQTVHHTYVSEWDKNLHALAETGASCYRRRRKGICDTLECATCEKLKLYLNCLNALSDFDILRVNSEIHEIIDKEIADEAKLETMKKIEKDRKIEEIKYGGCFIIMGLFVMILALIAASASI